MSQERELKFRLDPALHDAVRRHPVLQSMAQPPRVQALQTWYFDTPAHALREAGLALRVRHPGDGRRILTLKSSPAQGLQLARGEWEFDIDADTPDAAIAAAPASRTASLALPFICHASIALMTAGGDDGSFCGCHYRHMPVDPPHNRWSLQGCNKTCSTD